MTRMAQRESLTGEVIRAFSERIASGDYKPGEKLPTEQDLIREFGVSRTVVREAFASLRARGMISTQQGVGAFVASATRPFEIEESVLGLVDEMISVLELRVGIESEAAALAAVKRQNEHLEMLSSAVARMAVAIAAGGDSVQADVDFHRAVAGATQNRHFVNLFNYLGGIVIPRTRIETFKLLGDKKDAYLARINAEHQQILHAIEQSDPEGARAAMRLHLTGSRDRLRQVRALQISAAAR